MVSHPATPAYLLEDLLAMEEQRITLNMQIGLLHSIVRQALACANKMERAENVYLRRLELNPSYLSLFQPQGVIP
jgi:regulator of sirC expression with transglutaminase-like and TPR domain